MGSQCSGQQKINTQIQHQITIATLNYCGISNSPFQFYVNQYQHQLKIIGRIFISLCKQQFPEYPGHGQSKQCKKTTQLFGQIEKKFKTGRYSPLFNKMNGFSQIKKGQYQEYQIQNETQFNKTWDKALSDQLLKFGSLYDLKYKQYKQKQFKYYSQNVRKYDFLIFKALLKYVFKFQDSKQKQKQWMQNKNKDINISNYFNIIGPFFQLSFLNPDNKLGIFQYGFRKLNPDVFFVQEISTQFKQFLQKKAKKNYWYAYDDDQAIILKKDAFLNQQFQIVRDLSERFQLNYPERNVQKGPLNKPLALASKNTIQNSNHRSYLFVCLHFASPNKEGDNQNQQTYLKYLLGKANRHFINVIIGGDLNKFVKFNNLGYQYFPKYEQQITTFKKRTKLQTQTNKSDVIIKKSIDKIITNRRIIQRSITLIDGSAPDQTGEQQRDQIQSLYLKLKRQQDTRQKQQICQKIKILQQNKQQDKKQSGKGLDSKIKMLLPCDVHPFDQFLVKVKIQILKNSTITNDCQTK